MNVHFIFLITQLPQYSFCPQDIFNFQIAEIAFCNFFTNFIQIK